MRAILIRRRNSTLPGDTPAVLPAHHPKLILPTMAIGSPPPRIKIKCRESDIGHFCFTGILYAI